MYSAVRCSYHAPPAGGRQMFLSLTFYPYGSLEKCRKLEAICSICADLSLICPFDLLLKQLCGAAFLIRAAELL